MHEICEIEEWEIEDTIVVSLNILITVRLIYNWNYSRHNKLWVAL